MAQIMSLDVFGKMAVPALPTDTATGGDVNGLMAVRLLQTAQRNTVKYSRLD
jgi:hypothetical protein